MSGGVSFSVTTMWGSVARMCLLSVQTQDGKNVASSVSLSQCEHTKRTRAAHFICGWCLVALVHGESRGFRCVLCLVPLGSAMCERSFGVTCQRLFDQLGALRARKLAFVEGFHVEPYFL